MLTQTRPRDGPKHPPPKLTTYSKASYTTSQDLTAPDESTACVALDEFAESELGQKYPQSVKVWRDAWERFVPFLQFPPMARKVIYTTNSIESMNNELRNATRNRVQFTNDDSAIKTLWLMICNIEDKRALPVLERILDSWRRCTG